MNELYLVGALSWAEVDARGEERRRRPRRQRRRWRLVAAAAVATLAITGTAIGVGITLLDQQEAYHDRASDHPERLGPLVEITSGKNWALIAWQSNFGVCLDFAILGNSSFGCDFPVYGAKPATNSSGSGPPIHAVAGYISGAGLVGGDGETTILGVAAHDVAAVRLELRDGRTVDPPVYDAPPALGAEVRFFIVRTLVAQEPSEPGSASLAGKNPVRAFVAYDRLSNVIERVEG